MSPVVWKSFVAQKVSGFPSFTFEASYPGPLNDDATTVFPLARSVSNSFFSNSLKAEEPAGFAVIGLGRAIRLALAIHAAENVVRGGPLDVVADQQVEPAVAVEI